MFPHESVKVTVKGMSVPTGQLSLMANLNALLNPPSYEYNKATDEAFEDAE